MNRSLIAITLLAATSPACGQTFFSIDRDADTLVRIDAAGGLVSVIGSLDYDAVRIALATLDDKLYAVNFRMPDAEVDLIEIDTATGAATLRGRLMEGDDPVTSAEGLTVRDGVLVVSYTTEAASSDSHFLGSLAIDGAVTPLGDVSLDMDATATDPNGRIYAQDYTGPDSRLYRIEPNEFVGAHPGGYDDLTFARHDLWAMLASSRLLRLDTATGALLETVMLDPPAPYSGLAYETHCHDSCPADIDGDGDVGFSDLLEVLAAWGTCEGK